MKRITINKVIAALLPPINIRAWMFKDDRGRWQPNNWGDDINLFFLRTILRRRIKIYTAWQPTTKRLALCIGTVLRQGFTQQVQHVWGTGLSTDQSDCTAEAAISSVRGPLTRQQLWGLKHILAPSRYGDAALLLSRYYRPADTGQRYRLGIVLHHSQTLAPQVAAYVCSHPDTLLIAMRGYRHWTDVIDAVCSCDAVMTSSLHGMIIADTYAVPNLWIELPRVGEKANYFKFVDYLLSVCRTDSKPFAISCAADIDRARTTAWFRCAPHIDYNDIADSCPWRRSLRPFRFDAPTPARSAIIPPDAQQPTANPLLTVIMPVHNGEKYLQEAINSLQRQTLKAWRCIIVVSKSTDQSLAIAQQAAQTDSRIRVLKVPHRGVSHARNIGIEHIHTPYVTFMDGDDRYADSNTLQHYITLIGMMGPRTVVQMPVTKLYNDNSTEPIPVSPTIHNTSQQSVRALFTNTIIPAWGKIYTADIFETGLRFKAVSILEDYIFLGDLTTRIQRYARDCKGGYIWRKHKDSATENIHNVMMVEEYIQAGIHVSKILHRNKYIDCRIETTHFIELLCKMYQYQPILRQRQPVFRRLCSEVAAIKPSPISVLKEWKTIKWSRLRVLIMIYGIGVERTIRCFAPISKQMNNSTPKY